MATDLQTDLGRRIKAARVLSGKKAGELAAELGWSPDKLYKLERGDRGVDAIDLAAIASATNQPLDFFFGASLDEEGATLPQALPAGQVVAGGDGA